MKRSLKSLILVLVLVALVAGYWLVTGLTANVSVKETSVSTELVNDDMLSAVTWTYEGETITLKLENDTWKLADNPEYPISQSAVKTMLGDFSSAKAKQKLEGISDLADYGFETPSYIVSFTENGVDKSFKVGDATPTSDGYYLYDGSDVYVIGTSLETVFKKSVRDLTHMDEIPSVTEATHIVINGPYASLDQTYYEDTAAFTYNPDWHWFETGTAIPSQTESVDRLMEMINTFAWNLYVTFDPSEEDIAELYGLHAENRTTISIYNGEEEPYFEMYIGKGSNDGYFAMIKDSKTVYTLADSDTVMPIVNMDNSSMRAANLLCMEWEDVTEITFDAGTPLTMIRTESAAPAAAEGETEAAEESVVAVTVNGAAVDPEAAKEAFEALALIAGKSAADVAEITDPILTITAKTTSEAFPTITIKVGRYDASNYVAITDAQPAMLVEAAEVDALIRTFGYIPAVEAAE